MFKVEEFDRERFIKLFSEQTNQKYISRKNIIKFLEKFFKRHSLSGKAPNNQILIAIEEPHMVTICGFKVNKYDYVKYSSHLTLKA